MNIRKQTKTFAKETNGRKLGYWHIWWDDDRGWPLKYLYIYHNTIINRKSIKYARFKYQDGKLQEFSLTSRIRDRTTQEIFHNHKTEIYYQHNNGLLNEYRDSYGNHWQRHWQVPCVYLSLGVLEHVWEEICVKVFIPL